MCRIRYYNDTDSAKADRYTMENNATAVTSATVTNTYTEASIYTDELSRGMLAVLADQRKRRGAKR